MVFNSVTFFVFLALVLAVHYSPLAWTPKKAFLTAASYAFYGAWNPPFALLLLGSTVLDHRVGLWIEATTSDRVRKLLMATSLLVNLGLLGAFKYGDFLLASFGDLVAALGGRYRPPALDLVLPVGISFYTFQTLSYTIDVYRRRIPATRSFLDFALFVAYFPQLVAGPIVRAADFLPQLDAPRAADLRRFAWGFVLVVVGLFEKVVIADGLLSGPADRVFDLGGEVSTADAWLGTLAFAGQIFCDFDGYSLAAIGVAMTMGFVLPDNFRFPYGALGFSDFWRRWHMSLSTWLRDYLYIALGGNRRGPGRTQINLMLTMLLGGLWHGAAWTFVLWGALHGTFLVLERRIRQALVGGWVHTRAARGLGIALTFALTCLAWIPFRADGFDSARRVLRGALLGGLSLPRVTPTGDAIIVTVVVAALVAFHVFMRDSTLEERVGRMPMALRVVALAAMMVLILTASGNERAFIYFRF